MGKRATFTEAELSRAIRVADKLGKTVIQTRDGIAFVERLDLAQTAVPESDEVDTCAGKFGRAR